MNKVISKLKGKKILVTAGPTREYLDPVRYLSNESSGKMGYAIAEVLHGSGAQIILISGPVNICSDLPSEIVFPVTSASQMFEVCKSNFENVEGAIFCAAVADYAPKHQRCKKIKKEDNEISFQFVKNPDIAFEFSKFKTSSQKSIGFALETDDLLHNARQKLVKKRFDFIVLNSSLYPGEGFGCDTNKISILKTDGSLKTYPLKQKKEVAYDIVKEFSKLF